MKKSEIILLLLFITFMTGFIFIKSDFGQSILFLFMGSFFTIFGAKLLFQKRFVEKLREKEWKPGEDERNISEKESYFIDKYITGLYIFIGGLISLVASLFYWLFN